MLPQATRTRLHHMLTTPQFHYICNGVLAAMYLFFVVQNIMVMQKEGYKLSIIMLIIFNALLFYLILTRRAPKKVSFAFVDIVVTFFGTFILTLAKGVPQAADIWPLQIAGACGMGISVLGLLTLRKSFGLLPADRGIVSHGVYRFIRHPIYAGYVLHYACFLAQNYSIPNATIFILFLFFEGFRLLREEKLLSQNPDYAAYMQRTRWRICPRIW
jgi:protein-S-isoprenylcysteine O-methyltransferase Ste14